MPGFVKGSKGVVCLMGEPACMRSGPLPVVLAVTFALLATACGSTLPQAQNGAAIGAELGDATGGTIPPGAHINSKGQVVNAEGEVIGNAEDFGISTYSASEGASSGSVSGTPTDQGRTSVGVNGPGVTADTIMLGLPVWEDLDAGISQVGADITPGWRGHHQGNRSAQSLAGDR